MSSGLSVDALRDAYGSVVGDPDAVEVDEGFGPTCVDVPADAWHAAVLHARDGLGLTYFDWLSAVDEGDAVRVVVHVARVGEPAGEVAHLLVRTSLPADDLRLATIIDVYRGAAWHERETYEMFGVIFEGHDNLRPLLLPDGFEGNPLRKEFMLAARAAKVWPGAKEPGESDSGAPSRRRMTPPGVPDPETWGPR